MPALTRKRHVFHPPCSATQQLKGGSHAATRRLNKGATAAAITLEARRCTGSDMVVLLHSLADMTKAAHQGAAKVMRA